MTKIKRAQRWQDLYEKAKPCPKCGGAPDIDIGLTGEEFEPGLEFFSCPTVIGAGNRDHICGVSAQGLEAWNHQPVIDLLVDANTTGDLATLKRQLAAAESDLAETRALLAKATRQLHRVHTDAWHQCKGHGVKTTDGRDFSLYQLNVCGELAGQLDRAVDAGGAR